MAAMRGGDAENRRKDWDPARNLCYAYYNGELDAFDSASTELRQFPYGAFLAPVTDGDGHAVLMIKQPGVGGRRDVLVIEKVRALSVDETDASTHLDPRRGFEGLERLRVEMEQVADDAGGQPASIAILRIATSLGPHKPIDECWLSRLKMIRYSIRPGDAAGWFEHGNDAFPDPAFRHGHPDIATRDQGDLGIRGPSRPAMGLQTPIDPTLFAPRRERPIDPSERSIYEIHIGTFTPLGTLTAAADRLSHLQEMGFTTIQLMPVDLSSGMPGWSYDQTRTGAVETASYGGTEGLIGFVEQAHQLGLEVIIDKQYNHEGPEQDSRSQIIPGMFGRQTKWGAGLSGEENPHVGQVIKLIGEEMAYWVLIFGVDGFRFDATNRLPAEVHWRLADFGRVLEEKFNKPIYLISEYAECEEPAGQRVPTGHQYADQAGRLLTKLLNLSRATHVTELPADHGSTLKAMLKAARRGWWYPDVPAPPGGLSGIERSTTLLWNHDWIGNRFGGERISQLITFALYKTIAVWQILGQWTPFIFMGTENYCKIPWYFFTGHKDDATRNNTSAYYEEVDGKPVLKGGRFLEFRLEAEAIGLKEALAFSADGTVADIDWQDFRSQTDKFGNPYMDHARREAFTSSKINWDNSNDEQTQVEALFKFLLKARIDERIKESDPVHVQYKGWEKSERVFIMRRRDRREREFIGLFNLGIDPVSFTVSADGIEAQGIGDSYLIAIDDGTSEAEWTGNGRFSLWLDTEAHEGACCGSLQNGKFTITDGDAADISVPAESAVVFTKDPI